ncbi:MAG TPA: cytochrome b [Steroidobacteraceae bacterium]|nr:cytochrome b [Steroidobacteraceae bacterium]
MVNQRYTTVAIVLHWAIAVLILFNLGFGFFMEGYPPSLKGVIIPMHISSGLTVLALTVLRILWRLAHKPPPFFATLAGWERGAAHGVHFALYLIMIGMPLTGWALISAHPYRPGMGPTIWWLLHVPAISPVAHMEVNAQQAAHESLVQAHSIGGWIAVGLLVLHVGAALKHQFFDREPEFRRMGVGS